MVETDHQALILLVKKTRNIVSNNRIERWILFMNPFDFKIKYKNGVHNIHADALSRLNYANELVSIGGKSDNIIVSVVEKEAEDEEFKNKRRHSS